VLRPHVWWTPTKKVVISIFGESKQCASVWTFVVNCQKRAVCFPEDPVNLIKMHLNIISYEFLICDAHMQLLWWNIAVGNFTWKQNNCWHLFSFVTSCWWLTSMFPQEAFPSCQGEKTQWQHFWIEKQNKQTICGHCLRKARQEASLIRIKEF